GSTLPSNLGVLRALRTTDAKEIWKHESQGRIYHKPCYDDDQVYFTSDRGIAAVSRKDGQPRWSRNFENGPGSCVVLPAKGLFFVGAGDGLVYALDTKKAEVQWQMNILADAP